MVSIYKHIHYQYPGRRMLHLGLCKGTYLYINNVGDELDIIRIKSKYSTTDCLSYKAVVNQCRRGWVLII